MFNFKCVCIATMVKLTIVLSVILGYFIFKSEQSGSSNAENKNLKLVIDNDGGADDAMAISLSILAAKHFDNIQLLGLTTTHGNVNEDQVFYNNQRILKLVETDTIPIYRGVNYSIIHTPPATNYFGHDGMGDTEYHPTDLKPADEEKAVDALIRLSKEHEDELVVVSIGPLTNIALAVSLDPKFLGRLKQLYVGAGHIHDDVNNEVEFNAFTDPEAYYKVVNKATPDKVTVFPYSQVLSFLKIDKSWRLNTLGAINSSIIRTQNTFEQVSLPKWDFWADLDPAVLATVLSQDVVEEYKYSKNSITLCGEKRGFTTNEFVEKDEANVRLLYSANVDKYKQYLLDVFSAEIE